ncbi:amino acid permease [Lactococcus muris]|uniref:Amino acid permease n=1 Tax=Lactococcus muris TaxID=2941330 RepID=A0ABV4DB03_9LACT
MENSKQKLKSSMKARHVIMLSLGGAIGAGLFAGSSSAIQASGPAVMLAYLLAGIILYVVMYGAGQIILHQKETTVGLAGLIAPYVGKRFAHFTDWVYWSLWMAAMVAESVAIAQFLGVWLPQVPSWIFVLIVAIITLGLNLYSVRVFAETEYWLAWAKIMVILILIVVGLYLVAVQVFHLGLSDGLGQMNKYGGFMPNGMKGVFNAMLIVIYSYGGSELIALTVSEVENPKKAIPKAIRGVIMRIFSFYVIPMFIFVELYSWKFLSSTQKSPFVLIFEKLGIPGAALIVNFVIILALFSVINSAVYATSRSVYSRAKDSKGIMGKTLGKLSSKRVPVPAIIFCSGMLFIGAILSFIFKDNLFVYLAGSISYTILIVWIMLLISAIIFYFKTGIGGWFIKAISILTLLVLLIISYKVVVSNPWGISVFALVVCVLSLLSYREKTVSEVA